MNLTKKAISVALAAALAGGFTGVANAAVLAQSTLLLSNLTFSSGGSALDVTDFQTLIFSDSTDITATLNGVSASGTAGQSIFGTLDLAQQCVGACVFGANDYSSHLGVTGTFARGDTLLDNSPISGTSLPVGAIAKTLAEAQLLANGGGSTQSNLGLISSFVFAFAGTGTKAFDIDFDATIHLIAQLSADAHVPGSNAQASANWSFSITDLATGDEVFAWDPQGTAANEGCDLNRTVATQIPGVTRTYDCTGHFSNSALLGGGTLYELNLRHTTEADASNLVPEPASIALVGLGLLGLGAARRRVGKNM